MVCFSSFSQAQKNEGCFFVWATALDLNSKSFKHGNYYKIII